MGHFWFKISGSIAFLTQIDLRVDFWLKIT
jgi:hypothetical protein